MENSIETIARQTLDYMQTERKDNAKRSLEHQPPWLRVEIVDIQANRCDAIVHSKYEDYEVSINDREPACLCKDHEYRGVTCKHIAAVCYTILGSTTPEAPETFQCGERVQLRGMPTMTGVVRCVSELISVAFPAMGHKLAFTRAYSRVELERARQ